MACLGAVRAQRLQSSPPSNSQQSLQQPYKGAAASRGHPASRRPQRCGVACSSGGSSSGGSSSGGAFEGLPADSAAVAGWAARGFREAAQTGLTRACLFLALEEEAASQAAYAEAEQLDGGAGGVELRGSVGSASTWSLDRIASLAEEATRAFYLQLQDLGVAGGVELAAGAQATDSALLTLHLDLVRSYPMQLIQAVNQVLYERHGYRRQRRHGDPLDSRLSNVLENGNGSPGSLAVLYLELCARLGLDLQPAALEGGRYFVLMPTGGEGGVSLSAAGEQFVIDPYSEGMLLSVAEVKELFEVEGELAPCGSAAMLACILAVLRDSHWCAAIKCPPEPLWAVPISVEVALGEYRDVEVETSSGEDEGGEYFRVAFTEAGAGAGPQGGGSRGQQQWWPEQGYNLQRALAAAQKRSWLQPDDLDAQLEHGLLLYFSQQYEDAWQELGIVLQAAKGRVAEGRFDPQEVEQLEVLWEKTRLQLVFAAS